MRSFLKKTFSSLPIRIRVFFKKRHLLVLCKYSGWLHKKCSRFSNCCFLFIVEEDLEGLSDLLSENVESDSTIFLFLGGKIKRKENYTEMITSLLEEHSVLLSHFIKMKIFMMIVGHRISRTLFIKRKYRQELMRKGLILEIRAIGDCMKPILNHGDIVKVVLGKEPEIGEIALIDNETFLIHQIQAIFDFGSNKYFVHSGLVGSPIIINKGQILGTVVSVIRKHQDYFEPIPQCSTRKNLFLQMKTKQLLKLLCFHLFSAK